MVFFSNGQNESNSSGDSSGSDSDSEEKRFYSKINNSQRQQSSSTSGSSADLEAQQVSSRPVAEKPVALPSPKKKPNAADRSAARNQGAPTEPNLKTPYALKPKKTASPKRVKDDDDAEEQSDSQRQQSSSTTVSLADSEPEQVSNRPVVEKPFSLPSLSPKKKPNSVHRSAVRNQGTPSEPNLKTPSALTVDRSAVRNQGTPSEPNLKTPSALKPKKTVSAKRAKDDGDAEEQSEPKKKKGKKPAEEEVAKEEDDAAEEQIELKKKSASKGKKPDEAAPASNSMKKKPRKQPQESATAITVVTPTAKDSPQKSSKKSAQAWTDNDESVIMHGYLVCAKEGLEFPKNIPQLIEKINDSLTHEVNKSQLYEKLRRMKARYGSIKDKIAQGNIKEEVFAYKSPHEKEMYKLWKHAWGEHTEGEEIEVEPAEDAMEVDRPEVGEEQTIAGNHGEEDEEEEEEVESDAGTETVKDVKIPMTHIPAKALVSNHIPVKVPVYNHIPAKAQVSSTPMPNDKPEDMIDYQTIYQTIMKETRDMISEVVADVKKTTENSEAEVKAFLDSQFSSASGAAGTVGGSGRRVNSAVWLRNREPCLDGIYSLRELPPLGGARLQMLEGKWREAQILEMQATAKRLALLKQECSMYLEELRETGGNARS